MTRVEMEQAWERLGPDGQEVAIELVDEVGALPEVFANRLRECLVEVGRSGWVGSEFEFHYPPQFAVFVRGKVAERS